MLFQDLILDFMLNDLIMRLGQVALGFLVVDLQAREEMIESFDFSLSSIKAMVVFL